MKKGNKLKELFEKKGFYVVLYSFAAVIVVIAGIMSISNINSINKKNKEPIDDNNSMVQAETEAQEANQSNVKSYHILEEETKDSLVRNEVRNEAENEIKREVKREVITEATTEATTINQNQTKQKEKETTTQPKTTAENNTFNMFDETKEMSWPVNGQIVMDYSIETAIYDKTLDQYRTNDSISISAPVGTEVKAAAEGVVEKIFTDEENGQSIVLNHGNGWLTTYSQLEQKTVLVKEGQIVKEGETLGKVGEPTNYSVMLGSHLDFKITKDELAQDPKLVLVQYDE